MMLQQQKTQKVILVEVTSLKIHTTIVYILLTLKNVILEFGSMTTVQAYIYKIFASFQFNF